MAQSIKKSLTLAVTGGIGCGKSAIGILLKNEGFIVCDADYVAHRLMKKKSAVYDALTDFFGDQIIRKEDQEIDRKVLGKMIFEDPEKRKRLNELVHPHVRKFFTCWIKLAQQSGKDHVALIPLLFESQMDDLNWDAIMCVSTNNNEVIKRLAERGLNEAESIKRIEAQWPLAEKQRRSNINLENNSTLEELNKVVKGALKKLRAKGL